MGGNGEIKVEETKQKKRELGRVVCLFDSVMSLVCYTVIQACHLTGCGCTDSHETFGCQLHSSLCLV